LTFQKLLNTLKSKFYTNEKDKRFKEKKNLLVKLKNQKLKKHQPLQIKIKKLKIRKMF